MVSTAALLFGFFPPVINRATALKKRLVTAAIFLDRLQPAAQRYGILQRMENRGRFRNHKSTCFSFASNSLSFDACQPPDKPVKQAAGLGFAAEPQANAACFNSRLGKQPLQCQASPSKHTSVVVPTPCAQNTVPKNNSCLHGTSPSADEREN